MRLSKELTPEELAAAKEGLVRGAEATATFLKSIPEKLNEFLEKHSVTEENEVADPSKEVDDENIYSSFKRT